MGRGKLENVLEKEGVKLGELPRDDQLRDGPRTMVSATWIEPVDWSPTFGREL